VPSPHRAADITAPNLNPLNPTNLVNIVVCLIIIIVNILLVIIKISHAVKINRSTGIV
jgi:hypothetical protein